MAKVIRASAVPLADGMGESGTEPVIDLDAGSVWFNGVEDDGCETFYWPPDLGRPVQDDPGRTFDFCKTWGMPYDSVVVACLLVAQRVLGEQIEVAIDGTLEDFLDHTEHGEPGEESPRNLYLRVFGSEPPIPASFTRDR